MIEALKILSIFEIGPIFNGTQPGEQSTIICGLSAGKKSRLSWIENERNIDVFDIKRDVIKTLVEAGYNSDKFFIDSETPRLLPPWQVWKAIFKQRKRSGSSFFWGNSSKYFKKNRYKNRIFSRF